MSTEFKDSEEYGQLYHSVLTDIEAIKIDLKKLIPEDQEKALWELKKIVEQFDR